MSKEVKRYNCGYGESGGEIWGEMHEASDGDYVDAEAYDALLAERDRMAAENKRLDLMVAQADHNYDMDRNRMLYLLKNALICLEQWNLKHPRLAKRGDEGSSEYTYRQIRAFLPEYREFDAALQGAQP